MANALMRATKKSANLQSEPLIQQLMASKKTKKMFQLEAKQALDRPAGEEPKKLTLKEMSKFPLLDDRKYIYFLLDYYNLFKVNTIRLWSSASFYLSIMPNKPLQLSSSLASEGQQYWML